MSKTHSTSRLALILFLIFSQNVSTALASAPDDHAPIGVMGDHRHLSGESMLSYRFMDMTMKGNRTGTTAQSNSDVLADFTVAPTEMHMQMHMLGLMVAPSDAVTLMTMLSYISMSMDHRMGNGNTFTTRSKGMGDTKVAGLINLKEFERSSLHLNFGLSLPTGSIDARDSTPMGSDLQLPYPMQLGSGTFDLLPGITYLAQFDVLSFGGQILAVIRTGKNTRGYRLGNRASITAWGAYRLLEELSASLRLNAQFWANIKDQDSALNPNMVPTADPDLRGGKRLDLLVGFNYAANGGFLDGHRLAVEFSLPIYQFLNGPQLETDWSIIFGWQVAFVPAPKS